MKTNKILIFIASLILIIACKKNISENETNIKDTLKMGSSNSVLSTANKIENTNIKSFVISCGSGCAMTYDTENIININPSSKKVKFKVDMYVDEQLSDTYYETYIFSYDESNKINKIQQEGKNENILETLTPEAQKSFKDFGNGLIHNTSKESDLNKKNTFLYDKKNNPKTVKYQIIETLSIKGLEKYSCGEPKTRYLPLPKKSDISIFLVPQDCGDFEYRYYLITMKNNTVIDNLYVEGEWSEPDSEEDKETTSFSMDKKYNLIVKTQTSTSSKSENYTINDDGKIIKQ
jgi:hypothetical protein